MSTPIIEQIAIKLAALVNAITEANGFNQTLTAVRPKRLHLETDLNDDLTVVIEYELEKAVIIDECKEIIIWEQPITLQAIVLDSDDTTAPLDTRLNQVRNDIERKLKENDNWKLDGLVEGIFFRAPEKFLDNPKASGIAINIDVLYHVDADNPSTQTK